MPLTFSDLCRQALLDISASFGGAQTTTITRLRAGASTVLLSSVVTSLLTNDFSVLPGDQFTVNGGALSSAGGQTVTMACSLKTAGEEIFPDSDMFGYLYSSVVP